MTDGTFTSPNYPNEYDNDASCDFVFKASEGEVITVTFNDFDLEANSGCGYDVLEVGTCTLSIEVFFLLPRQQLSLFAGISFSGLLFSRFS